MKDFHILVIRPGAIGDVLLAFPVLKALRERYANAHITLVSNGQVLPLALACGVAEEVSDYQDMQWGELFSSSGIHSPALACLLDRTDLAICWLRDADGIVERNLNAAGVKRLVIAPGRPPPGTDMHILDYLAQTIGLPPVGARLWTLHMQSGHAHHGTLLADKSAVGAINRPLLVCQASCDEQASAGRPQGSPLHFDCQMNLDRPIQYVAIHPGSGGARKCWQASHFAGVIERLWQQNRPVLLLEGPAETERVRDLLNLVSSPPVPGMLRMLTHAPLLEVAHQLQRCRCYLGNDSGITHLAAMLGVPTVAIFGPSDPAVWGPVGPSVKVIQERALEDVSVDMVMEAIDSFYQHRT